MSKSRKGEGNSMYGRKHSKEAKEKMSKVEVSEETKAKMSKSAKNRINKESIKKSSEIFSRTTTCPHCKKELNLGNAKRWYFDNCKERKCLN